jgi:hypothetical protein
VRFQVLTAASMKFRVFWDLAPCSHVEVDRRPASIIIALLMEAVCTSETLVNFNVNSRRCIPEYSKLHKHLWSCHNIRQRKISVVIQPS